MTYISKNKGFCSVFVQSRLKPVNSIKTESTDALLQNKMSSLDNHNAV